LRDKERKRRIDDTLDTLKERPDAGDPGTACALADRLQDAQLDNLFRIEVGRSQRMTYSIRIGGEDATVLVIEFFASHKEYERRFGY
jgi:hypothetical protein